MAEHMKRMAAGSGSEEDPTHSGIINHCGEYVACDKYLFNLVRHGTIGWIFIVCYNVFQMKLKSSY